MSSVTTDSSLQTTSSKTDACCMAFTPQSCSTKGGEVLFITFSDDYPLPSEAEFFLVFEGCDELHVTTSQQINQYTLRAVVPGHDTAERVLLTLYCLKDNTLDVLSSHRFLYFFETEKILAELLAQNVSDSKFLESFVSLCSVSNNVSCSLRDDLDSRFTSAFELLNLSPSWTVLGDQSNRDEMDNGFATTLLHLSAHLGFSQFAKCLLDQPGASHALNIQDKNGKLPLDIAEEKGLQLLIEMFSSGAGERNKPKSKENSKPPFKKSGIGTTIISRHKREQENMIEKDIDMLRGMNKLVKDEVLKKVIRILPHQPKVKKVTLDFEAAMWHACKDVIPEVELQGCVFHWTQSLWRKLNKKVPIFMHSWPVVKTTNAKTAEERDSILSNDISKNEHTSKKDVKSPSRVPGSNRLLLEQNLKRLRDINEEIQRLRVTSQRNYRETGRVPLERRQMRRLSCPSFRGQDILQAHMMISKPVTKEEKKSSEINDKAERETSSNSTSTGSEQTYLDVVDTSDLRRRSWGDNIKEEEKSGFSNRVSSSLDDLTGSENLKKTRDPSRSRTQVIDLPKNLTKQEETNKLAEIIDSIKHSNEEHQSHTVEQKDLSTKTANSVSMQGKSYSYSCLADLKLVDGVDGEKSGEIIQGDESSSDNKTPKEDKISLLDFLDNDKKKASESSMKKRKWASTTHLGSISPDDNSEDSEDHLEKDNKAQSDKGFRRFSMLFGSKSAKHTKRELPKPGHSKSGLRSSMRKEKGQSMTNLSVKDVDLRGDSKDNKDAGNKTALARRASGLSQKGSKLGEAPTFPNPGMLTKMGNHSNKLPVSSHSFKSTSPLPFRKSLNPSHDEGDDKSISGMSLEGSGDEDDDEVGVFTGEGWTDSDLEMKEEPDAWNLTVDKKILKKMTAKDIKRQDVIYELIQTEAHYVRTLKIMFKIFYSGMVNTLHMTKETVDRMFPQIEELLEMHTAFLSRLRGKADAETIVEKVGDVLEEQFSGQTGHRMKKAYGDFCSHHIEAVDLYKKKLKNDKKFADFVKKCGVNKLCRRLSVPECITLVTQRLTKYPLLFEAIIKTTKEAKQDYNSLKKALQLVKGVLHAVDNAIKDYEKQKTLQDIKMRMDLKSTITYKGGKKVKNIDFASNTSTLRHDGVLLWKTARGKLTESLVVILEDMLVFLQEKDQKFSLLSLDQKAPVIRLSNLFVREVATDTKAIFLVSTSKEGPEMYEMVCSTASEKRTWIKNIREAVNSAPKDESYTGELIPTAAGEKRKLILRRVEMLIEQIQNKEAEDQSGFLPEMQELITQLEAEEAIVKGHTKEELVKTRESLVQVMNQVQASLEESRCDDTMASPDDSDQVGFKRAETFSAFDNKLKVGADQVVNRAQSMKIERTGRSYSRQLPGAGAAPSPESGSPAMKLKRRGSGGSGKGWPIRSKSKDDKDNADSKANQPSSSTSSSPVNIPDQDQKENEDDESLPDQENCTDKPTPEVIYF